MLWRQVGQFWKDYKYRFLPWIVLNLKSNQKIRQIKAKTRDKIISDTQITTVLHKYYRVLERNNPFTPEQLKPDSALLDNIHKENLELTLNELGFLIERKTSGVSSGRGVYVTRGKVPKHSLVALYPGTVYQPGEPVLLQSINNKFIFKCSDSSWLDGNDRFLSKLVYLSLSERDRCGFHRLCDQTWLSDKPWNILAIGQYVNNETQRKPANVSYQEFYLPADFPLELLRYHCTVRYSSEGAVEYSSQETRGNSVGDSSEENSEGYKAVALVSLRDIEAGEELLSTYFTLIDSSH